MSAPIKPCAQLLKTSNDISHPGFTFAYYYFIHKHTSISCRKENKQKKKKKKICSAVKLNNGNKICYETRMAEPKVYGEIANKLNRNDDRSNFSDYVSL